MRDFCAFFICLVLSLASFSVTAEPIDINTADAEQIAASLKGVGPKKAVDIVRYREQNGPFKSIEDLSNVKGIGDRVIADNRGQIVVKAPTPEKK